MITEEELERFITRCYELVWYPDSNINGSTRADIKEILRLEFGKETVEEILKILEIKS